MEAKRMAPEGHGLVGGGVAVVGAAVAGAAVAGVRQRVAGSGIVEALEVAMGPVQAMPVRPSAVALVLTVVWVELAVGDFPRVGQFTHMCPNTEGMLPYRARMGL